MNIIIGCEESQIVCKALRAAGHDAYSCDVKPCSGGHPEWHIHGDVLAVLCGGNVYLQNGTRVFIENWDMGIFHPECTYLTITANSWFKDQPARKSGTLVGEARRAARIEAAAFFLKLYNCKIPKIAMENPIGVMSTWLRRPDQVIHPYQYGHPEKKATCLWLKGLPLLMPTNIVEPEFYVASGKKYSPTHYNSKRSLNRLDPLPAGPERSTLRSKTYTGIADAIAKQWGKFSL